MYTHSAPDCRVSSLSWYITYIVKRFFHWSTSWQFQEGEGYDSTSASHGDMSIYFSYKVGPVVPSDAIYARSRADVTVCELSDSSLCRQETQNSNPRPEYVSIPMKWIKPLPDLIWRGHNVINLPRSGWWVSWRGGPKPEPQRWTVLAAIVARSAPVRGSAYCCIQV